MYLATTTTTIFVWRYYGWCWCKHKNTKNTSIIIVPSHHHHRRRISGKHYKHNNNYDEKINNTRTTTVRRKQPVLNSLLMLIIGIFGVTITNITAFQHPIRTNHNNKNKRDTIPSLYSQTKEVFRIRDNLRNYNNNNNNYYYYNFFRETKHQYSSYTSSSRCKILTILYEKRLFEQTDGTTDKSFPNVIPTEKYNEEEEESIITTTSNEIIIRNNKSETKISDLLLLSTTTTTTTTTTATSTVDEIDTTTQQEHDEQTPKNIMLFLLWIIALLSAIDRVAMSIALVPLSNEYHISDTIKGSISSFFSLGYGFTIIPAGLVVANMSPRIVLACGIALWSIATIVTPNAADLLSLSTTTTEEVVLTAASVLLVPLLMVRAIVGAGESLVLPTAQKLLSIWTGPDEKGYAIALIFSGFKTGTIVAYLLSPLIMDYCGGWRSLFYVYGTFGLFIMITWLVLAQDTPKLLLPSAAASSVTTFTFATTTGSADSTVPLSPSAAKGIEANTIMTAWDESIKTFQQAPWQLMIRSKGSWGMLLAHCAKNWALYNTLSWTPTFYAEQYGIGVRDSAILSVLPSLAGVVGGFVAGITADTILQKLLVNNNINDGNNDGMDDEKINNNFDTTTIKTQVRKVYQSISLYGGAIALGTLAYRIPDDAFAAQTLLTISVFLQAFGAAGFEAGNQDKAGEKWAGLLYSVTSLPAVMFGTLGVWVTGRVLDLTNQDWSYVFAITASMNVLGATAFLLLFDSKREFE